MTIDDTNRLIIIRRWNAKALEALEDAELLFKHQRLSATINRLYYAAFNALCALAVQQKVAFKKHSQIIGWFNREYIKTGKIEKRFGRALHQSYDKRTKGDYDENAVFSIDEVQDIKNNIHELVKLLMKTIPIDNPVDPKDAAA